MDLPTYYSPSEDDFINVIYKTGMPAVLRNIDVGPCLKSWSPKRLLDKIGEKTVKVHVGEDPILNFITKNYMYKTLTFKEFIAEATKPCPGRFMYLRAIGDDHRGREVADLRKHFPGLADDFVFPSFLSDIVSDDNLLFSSVLRMSSAKLNLWTHYDVMDNVLVNVIGEKKVVLFPPDDVPFLYVVGDKSAVTNIYDSDENLKRTFPLFSNATKYECTLGPGDALFIPSLWFHNVVSLNFTVGVNIFWKDRAVIDYYDAKDVYGNKDVVPALHAFANVDKALSHLSKLPDKYRRFYTRILINKLEQKL